MRPPPRLSNCYTPLQKSSAAAANSKASNSHEQRKQQILSKRQRQQRKTFELRRLLLESNVIQSTAAQGSCLVELGHTKVLCSVIGPVTSSSPHVPASLQLNVDTGTLYVDVQYAPHTGYPAAKIVSESVRSMDAAAPSQQMSTSASQQHYHALHVFQTNRQAHVSAQVLSALTAAVPLRRQYPKCCIVVSITVLQDDGSIVPVCVTAATLAVAQAGLELYDLPSACTVAVVRTNPITTTDNNDDKNDFVLLADPTLDELSIADSVVEMTMLPNWKEVVTWDQQPCSGSSGLLSSTVTNQAVDLCRDGCRTMHKFLRQHLLEQAYDMATTKQQQHEK